MIGKFSYFKKNYSGNIILKISDFLSYYFGDSYSFSYSNIVFMRKFYLYFPIYDERFEKLTWDYYKELLKYNKNIAYFYYRICLFCNMDYVSFNKMISSDVYSRI